MNYSRLFMQLTSPWVIVLAALLTSAFWLASVIFANPDETAKAFLEDIQNGNLSKVVGYFGSSTCQCPIYGGWGSLLIYQSGEDPNLAFLLGHHFRVESIKVVPAITTSKPLPPGLHPQEATVIVPLTFNSQKDSPILLPFSLAYGNNMTLKKFESFIDNPASDLRRGFTLRLRSGLKAGSIKANEASIADEDKEQFSLLGSNFTRKSDASKSELPKSKAQSLLKSALMRHQMNRKLLSAQDSGKVLSESGVPIPLDELEKKLPRLQSIVMTLNLVRPNQIAKWSVFRFAFVQPTISEENGKKIVNLTSSILDSERMEHAHPEP